MTRLIFACSPSAKHFKVLRECNVQHVLVSYNFIKKVDQLFKVMGEYIPKTFTLDSGAFSVWSNGGRIDLFSYMLFAKRLRDRLPSEVELNVVNLDVLPGSFGQRPTQAQLEESAEEGWKNMLELEKEGLKVIHVYHQHEEIKWLDKMREHLPYIGISPANDVSSREKLQFMDSCYARIRDTVKTHGFAVTSAEQLYRYPLFSADSSSWVTPARFGAIPLFYDDLSIHWMHFKDKSQVLQHWDYVKHLGIDKLSDGWQDRTKLAVKTYQKLEEVATKLWKTRGISFGV